MKRIPARVYRARQEAYSRHIVETRTPAEARTWAMTWGGWHDHACRDCGTTFACDTGHGTDTAEGVHRCEPCFEAHYFPKN
jgi:hypothetical protein